MKASAISTYCFSGFWGLLAACWLLAAGPAAAGQPQVAAPTGPRPLQFVANRNQWARPVLFAADVPGGRLYLEQGRLLQTLYDTKAVQELHHQKPTGRDHRIRAHAYSVSFVGANRQAVVQGGDETGEVANYFLGKDRRKWARDVPAYHEVRYQELYPGTNLRFYTHDEQLEYDFELAPGADVRRIQLRYEGQQGLAIVQGALQVTTSVGTVLEQSPVAYQMRAGRKMPVACRYVLGAANTLSFAFPQGYDHALPLIVDPVLVYSSFSGSTVANWGFTATYDAQGNLYSGGTVFGVGYPATTGAYSVSFNGSVDYGIIKFNPTAGTGAASRVYATYLGGQAADRPHSMVVDPAGNLVILGTTTSADFPVTSEAFDTSFNNGADIVVSKLSPDGRQLLASTFFGGSGPDGQVTGALDINYNDTYRGDVTTDAQGNIYLATMSGSPDLPIVDGFQGTKSTGLDGVVARFSPDLSRLTWSTFLGGAGDDAAYSVQVDGTGTVFVSGGTSSPNFPGTAGGLHPEYQGGRADGFVARLAAGGNALAQASYIGTSGYDQAYFLQLDRQGEVYLFGQTNGAYPVSAGVYANPGSRQFIHKLNRQLTASRFSTVVGNGGGGSFTNISPTAFLVDDCGQILLSGFGGNIGNMPLTPNALQASWSSLSDEYGCFYLMQLSANAGNLIYGSYFGNGSCHVDGGTSRFDKQGIIYQSMCVGTTTTALPVTPNAFSTTNKAGPVGYSNAAFKMDVVPLQASFTASATPGGPRLRTGCAPLTVFFTRPLGSSTSAATWTFGNGLSSGSAAPTVSTVYTMPGTYLVRLTATDPAGCLRSATATDTLVVSGLPPAAAGPDQTICEGGSVTLSVPDAGPGVTYAWFPPTGLNTTTGRTVVATPLASTYYILTTTTPNNCTGKDTVLVAVAPRPQITAVAGVVNEFTGVPVAFSSTATAAVGSYAWDFGDGTFGTGAAPSHTYTRPGIYQVRLAAKYGPNGQCEETKIITVNIFQEEKPNVITPNGDGKNDTFRPFVTLQPVDIQIFNRWGKKVFEQRNYTQGWGPDNVPGGVYFYQLKSNTGENWKGWVEVVR